MFHDGAAVGFCFDVWRSMMARCAYLSGCPIQSSLPIPPCMAAKRKGSNPTATHCLVTNNIKNKDFPLT